MRSYLDRLLEKLSSFRFVFVTGPQRSGTRIASKIISYETGFPYVDESDFGIGNVDLLRALLLSNTNAVIQCPAISHIVHSFSTPADCIVFMHRDLRSILESQGRIDWRCEHIELSNYNVKYGPIAQVKYDFWHSVQKPVCHHAVDLNYSDLESHHLFVPRSRRINFAWNQTI